MTRKQKPYNAAPPVSGTMTCHKCHQWLVKDSNPERVAVKCPVCGGYTSIRQGLTK